MTKRMLSILLAATAGVCLLAGEAASQVYQSIQISSSPDPVGAGARAMGMGGAFIGVADDATAASWNPAGLVQLEKPEASVVWSYFQTGTGEAGSSIAGHTSRSALNYLSLAWPLVILNHNMIISLNYQQLYDFERRMEGGYRFTATDPALEEEDHLDYMEQGALYALSPAFAVHLHNLALGVTVNFWNDGPYDNEWTEKREINASGTLTGVRFTRRDTFVDNYRFSGVNFNLGMLWELNGIITVGAVFKAPFRARLSHDYSAVHSIVYPAEPGANRHDEDKHGEVERLAMPMSYGAGLAARLNDAITVDLDIYRTEWGDYLLQTPQATLSPITGTPEKEADIGATTQVRLGGEYLLIGAETVIPLRAGFFYDPEPAAGKADDFWGIALGTGLAYKNFVWDIAYQYRFGNDVRKHIIGNRESGQDIRQHTMYLSMICYF